MAHVARTVKARLDVARNDESGSTQQAETRSSPKTQTGSSAQARELLDFLHPPRSRCGQGRQLDVS